jgi:hypothetical protein
MPWDGASGGELCFLCFVLLIVLPLARQALREAPAGRAWCAGMMFVAVTGYGVATAGPVDPETAVWIGVRGALGAAAAFVVAALLAPLVNGIYGGMRRGVAAAREGLSARAARQAAEARRREEAERQRRDREDWERAAPERERQARAEAEAERRRCDARAACEYLYHLLAPEIGARFTRAMFDDWLRKYLTDGHPPEVVEERARQLQTLLQQHLAKVERPPTFKTLSELAAWFDRQKRDIDALPDVKLRQRMLAMLKERYEDLAARFLEELQP